MSLQQQSSAEWVDNDQRLAALSQQWQGKAAIAVDTEFIRSRTFYPITGLLQLADDQGVYLVDPLAIDNKEPLQQLLVNPQVVKVIHSCSEDLEVFEHYLGVLPSPLFDTQIAAAFAGYGSSIGYANLVYEITDNQIAKHETRSNWLQRPLSQSQLDYAALDVLHLLPIYNELLEALKAGQRLSWVEADCLRMLDNFKQADTINKYYLRIRSAWKCQPHQLSVLQQLSRWRELEVRQLNIPRNRLIKDISLLDIAQKLPDSTKKLRRVTEIHPKFVDRHGQQCIEIIQEALDNSENYPSTLPSPLTPEQVGHLKLLKSKVKNIADTLKLPPELLAPKKDLENLIRLTEQQAGCDLPFLLKGWRQQIIGKPLQNLLEQ